MYSSSAFLGDLSPEVQLAIIERLDHSSLRNWSSTCVSYRALLAPHIFKAISLCNTERSASSVDAVANGRNVACVEELHYTAEFSNDSERDSIGEKQGIPTAVSVFSEIVYKVLSCLDRFPSLHTLSLDFADFDANTIYWANNDMIYVKEESAEQVKEAEEQLGWRTLIARTFAALSETPRPSIKTFQIRQLPSKEVSPFWDDRFHAFLGTLERFGLSIHGCENCVGWNTNALDRHLNFISKLDKFFFNHLKSATHFNLRANKTGPIGLEGMRHARLALSPEQMPCLRSVYLENIFICEGFVNFLTAHADMLESLSMRDCYGGVYDLAKDRIYWERLFTALCNAKPRILRQVDILPVNLPIDDYADKQGAGGEEAGRQTKNLSE